MEDNGIARRAGCAATFAVSVHASTRARFPAPASAFAIGEARRAIARSCGDDAGGEIPRRWTRMKNPAASPGDPAHERTARRFARSCIGRRWNRPPRRRRRCGPASRARWTPAAVAAALQVRGAIAASMTGRQAEIAALAEELLRRAQSLDPHNPRWHASLGQFYAHRAESATGERRTTNVRKLMEEFNAAAAIDPAAVSALPPSRYARIAVEAGELDKAQASAEHCLAQIDSLPFKDTAIHECNLIVGRVSDG